MLLMKDSKISAMTTVCMTVLLIKNRNKNKPVDQLHCLRTRINLITMAVNAFLNQYLL